MATPRPTRLLALFAALAGVLACSGGCASSSGSRASGPGPVRASDRARVSDFDHAAFAALGFQLDWEGFPVVSRRGQLTRLVPYPDMVVVQESGSSVSVLEGDTGAMRGAIELGSELTRFVWIGRNDRDARPEVLVASESELFVVSGDTLALLDRQDFDEVVSTAPARAGSAAIFGTIRGRLLAHDTRSGLRVWGNSTDSIVDAAPVIVGDIVGVVAQSGQILFVRASDGSLVGQARIFEGLANDPVAGDERVFVAGLDRSVYAFAPFGGERLWRHRTSEPIRSQPRFHDGTLYVSLDDAGFTAFDPSTGEPRWSSDGARGELVGVQDGDLIVFDGQTASRIESRTGDVIASVRLRGVSKLATDTFVDGNLYAIRNGNRISKLTPR